MTGSWLVICVSLLLSLFHCLSTVLSRGLPVKSIIYRWSNIHSAQTHRHRHISSAQHGPTLCSILCPDRFTFQYSFLPALMVAHTHTHLQRTIEPIEQSRALRKKINIYIPGTLHWFGSIIITVQWCFHSICICIAFALCLSFVCVVLCVQLVWRQCTQVPDTSSTLPVHTRVYWLALSLCIHLCYFLFLYLCVPVIC